MWRSMLGQAKPVKDYESAKFMRFIEFIKLSL